MTRIDTFRIIFLFLTIPILALFLAGCGGENGEEESGSELVDSAPPGIDVRSGHVCTDEYEQALAMSTRYGPYDAVSIPALWNGTPFVVDVDAALPYADDLMDDIKREAERVRVALGYDLFVPGDVLPLNRISYVAFASSKPTDFHLLPPDGNVEIRCCLDGGEPGSIGMAWAWWRQVMLVDDSFYARKALIHELYHLFGFVHPEEQPGVEMSWELYWGSDGPFEGRVNFSTEADWARLACIFD